MSDARGGDAVVAIAHRAGNSLSALDAALASGADVVEADVHHYRGALEVRHLKTLGRVPLLWDTWRLVPASRPRPGLAEVLRAGAGRTTFMLDIKGATAAGAAVAELLHAESPQRPVIVCSRDWRSLEPFRGVEWIRTVASARSRAELSLLRTEVRARQPYGVSLHKSLVDAAAVAELRESAQLVMTWPVNDDATLDRVLSAGARGIITDDLAVLRRAAALPPR